jgi:hypothetical protein
VEQPESEEDDEVEMFLREVQLLQYVLVLELGRQFVCRPKSEVKFRRE